MESCKLFWCMVRSLVAEDLECCTSETYRYVLTVDKRMVCYWILKSVLLLAKHHPYCQPLQNEKEKKNLNRTSLHTLQCLDEKLIKTLC